MQLLWQAIDEIPGWMAWQVAASAVVIGVLLGLVVLTVIR